MSVEDKIAVPLPSEASFTEQTGIHRRFFRGGIFVLLTAGAVWGAFLLWRISVAGSFTAISIHDINAHGHAQIFGWVGLFVMGFSYQMFVHRKDLVGGTRRVATVSLVLMLLGIAARVVGEPLHEIPGMRMLALAGAAVEVLAIALFAFVVIRALRSTDRAIPVERPYAIAAVGMFLAQAVYEALMLAATTGDITREQLLSVISVWQAPLRDLQIHGFALLMILGVSLWLFPRTFAMARPPARLVRLGWIAILLAVAGESIGFVAMRVSGQRAWAGLLYVSILLLAGTSVALTWRWLPGMGPARKERSVKFVRAAVCWLTVAMAMLVLAPVYMFWVLPNAGVWSESGQRAVEIGFSHAFYGAIRHAITVGFVSLTIMGVSARIVPMLGGLATTGLRSLWVPFVLVNLGCAMRVSLQIATDFIDPAFALIGVSGLLEVSGLAAWGVHLWRIMGGRRVVADPGVILVKRNRDGVIPS